MSDFNLFSFKIIIHSISLTKYSFGGDITLIQKPGFKVKFVDFSPILIMSRKSFSIDDFSDQHNLLKKQNDQTKAFGKGKSVFFNSKYKDMLGYL